MHKASQEIDCPSCHAVFASGGAFIEHLEKNLCTGSFDHNKISRFDFFGSVKQKEVVKQIMKKPHVVLERLNANTTLLDDEEGAHPPLIADNSKTHGSTAQGSESGGIILMDSEDQAQRAFRLNTGLGDILMPLTRQNLETWPRLPGQPPSVLTESMRRAILQSPDAFSVSGMEYSANDVASDITSRRGGHKICTESYKSPYSTQDYMSTRDSQIGDDSRSTSTVIDSKQAAWKTGETSKALFSNAKATPVPGDWEAILEQRQAEASKSTNLFHARFWDTSSPDYNVDRFWNPLVRGYCCPFPNCDLKYSTGADIERHIREFHTKINHRCSCCFKKFKSHAGLVSHMESTTKCQIRQYDSYQEVGY